MSKYILHYFGTNGRACVPRAILSYAKADWTNDIISFENWPKVKESGLCEFKQLPVLEVNGKKYCESQAINLYLGETFNLMGKNAEENYQIINLLMTFEDIIKPSVEYLLNFNGSKTPENKKKCEEKLKLYIGQFEKRYLAQGKGKYFLGDKFTLADIFLGSALPNAFTALEFKDFPFKDVAPNLCQLIERITKNELKEFHEKYFIK